MWVERHGARRRERRSVVDGVRMVTYLCAIPSPTRCCGLFFIKEWVAIEEMIVFRPGMGVDEEGKGGGGGLSRQGLILDGF